MQTMPVLSIVVVSYNTREMTLACLRSVIDETRTPHELIVVDNASTDGSAAAIAAEFPQAMLLAQDENLWFAGGCNLGAARAGGEFILHLNPDTVVLDGAIDRLVDFARARPEAKIWGGRTVDAERRPEPSSCWGQMSLWNLFCRSSGLSSLFHRTTVFNGEGYGGWDRSTEGEVDIVSGCFLLMRRDDWNAMGGFDETFVMYGEEADLCLRARQRIAARPRITPAATIVHYGGASETVRADKVVRLFKAKTELIKRHFPSWQRTPALMLHMSWPLMRGLVLGAARRPSATAWQEIWARREEWRRGF